MNHIGEKIKYLRTKKVWSLRELENRTGINYSVLSRIESGKRPVTDQEIKIFADLFDVTSDYLLGRSSSQKLDNDGLPHLTEKDERDIAKKLENILESMEKDTALSFDGEPMDEETKELVRAAIENNLRLTKQLAKRKFTPKKYRDEE